MNHNFNLNDNVDFFDSSDNYHSYNKSQHNDELDVFSLVDGDGNNMFGCVEVLLDDINNLNLIINDDNCSDSFIEAICSQFDADGIKYKLTRQGNNLNFDNSVVVTLDQQYVSGPKISVIGSYENDRSDNSDALALAIETTLNSRRIECSGIICGKRGYQQNEQGISTRIPSQTESSIDQGKNISFVTIAFGTNQPSVEDTVDIIKESLARYTLYIAVADNDDLIYRANSTDTLESIAEKFNSTVFDVSYFNNIDSNIVSDEAIINPIMGSYSAFNDDIKINIVNDKEKKAAK